MSDKRYIRALQRSWIGRRVIPRYDELSLFLVSVTCLLLLATADWSGVDPEILRYNPAFHGIVGIAAIILVLPAVHVFSRRRKHIVEKRLMLFLAVSTHVIAGFVAAEYIMQSTTPGSWVSLFPAWNMLSAIMLVVGVRYGLVDEFCITDDNVNTPQVVAGIVVLLVGFAICHFMLRLHWSLTFSICVAFATAAGHAIRQFTPARMRAAGGAEATTR